MEVMTLKVEGWSEPISNIRYNVRDFSKVATVLDVSYHVVPVSYTKDTDGFRVGLDNNWDSDTYSGIDVVIIINYEDNVEVNEQQFNFIKRFFEEFIDKKTKTFKKDISERYHEACCSKDEEWDDDFWGYELAYQFSQYASFCTPKQVADVFNVWVNE
ncbi:hypothetical protein [Streptococcus sp.]|uniref:hypothetical protein n=1 Tax=Streptococcus sp. TaxID=1306 RepID=UPI000ECD38CB|nr:hypothetical protein [Streptococcus sp.]MCO4566562.1 hypothetical protein [Streptococcus infantarius subsp. infantarius]MCO4631311.1 hypothetical protein [Streptococcus infantarius subsp. infantarius]HCT82928.1 hypothetical protein [Streptococcus sp.]